MAAVKYHGILTALKEVFEGDPRTSHARVFVEEDPQFDLMGAGAAIVLVLNGRAASAGQPIAKGRRTRWTVRIGIWACGFAMTFEQAAQARDDLTDMIELVTMDNRTIKDKVASSWLEGGAFVSAKTEQGLFSSGETVLAAEITASN